METAEWPENLEMWIVLYHVSSWEINKPFILYLLLFPDSVVML